MRISVGREFGPTKDDLGFEVAQIVRVVRELGFIGGCSEFNEEIRLEKVDIALGGRNNAWPATPCKNRIRVGQHFAYSD